MANKSGNRRIAEINRAINIAYIAKRLRRNGKQMRYSTKNPVNPVRITHNVLISSDVNWKYWAQSKIRIRLITMVNPPGRDLLKMFFKNFPCTRSWLGSNANKNEGIPIVRQLIKVSWMGINGYGNRKNKKIKFKESKKTRNR